MSRAFVSEEAAEAHAELLLERPVSTAPNLVTPQGLAMIDAEIAALEEALAAAPAEDPERLRLARDLRYWRARHISAQVVTPASSPTDEVAFGTSVTVRRGDARVTYRIVGEDEADPTKGLISYVSPVAEALSGARAGDVVEMGEGRPAMTVEAISRD